MTIIKATYECDKCHLPIDDSNFDDFIFESEPNYNGEDFCLECSIEHDLLYAKSSYFSYKRWLDQTYLKKLKILKARLDYVKGKQEEFKERFKKDE